MLNKILQIVTLVCLSEIGFCQGHTPNPDSIPPPDSTHIKKDPADKGNGTVSPSGNTGGIKTTGKTDSIKRANKTRDSLKVVLAKAKTGDSLKLVHAKAKTRDSLARVAAKAKTRDSLARVTAKAKTRDSLVAANKLKRKNDDTNTNKPVVHEKKPIQQKPTIIIIHEPIIPLWLTMTVIALALITIFLLYKNRKMDIERGLREKMIDNYSSNVNALKNLLEKKGQLLPGAIFEIKNINSKIEELVDKYINGENQNQELNKELDDLRTKLAGSQAATGFIPFATNSSATYIKTEIILSAGPRKESPNNDTELGEDIAGSVSLPGKTYFWVLDGTSEAAIIKGLDISEGDKWYEENHIFSSRLLAQSIGYFIQKNINNYYAENLPLNELLANASKHVSEEWEKRLNKEPAEKKESILRAIGKGLKPICSTTVIVGCLKDNGSLTALRTGDSKVFPFTKPGKELMLATDFKFVSDPKPSEEYDRVVFRLDFDEAAKAFIIRQNEPKWKIQSADDIQCVFAFTDGIGRITEAQLASNNPGIVETIRQNIARIPQKSHDDKTLIILERINH